MKNNFYKEDFDLFSQEPHFTDRLVGSEGLLEKRRTGYLADIL